MLLTNNELLNIKGGISWSVIGFVAAGIAFVIGLIDGYVRPLKCNK